MLLPALEFVLDGRPVRVPAGRSFVIGRGRNRPIRASRRHAVVELTRGCWILTDRSGNGTFVDGRRVGVKLPTRPAAVTAHRFWWGPDPRALGDHRAPVERGAFRVRR
ncbi:MAG: transport system ATP-binding/permease protein [Pseudonocardiales bacterium]|nr:transport system ATP-binding/permease protein [Pseudonocardiales bacterium]